MTIETRNKNEVAEPTRSVGVKRLVMFLWKLLRKPVAWIALMLAVFVNERINGTSFIGSYWMTVCLFAFFAARIAEAIEVISKK